MKKRRLFSNSIHWDSTPPTVRKGLFMKIWSHSELDFLKKNVESMTYEQLSRRLGRTPAAIATKVRALNLRSFSELSEQQSRWTEDDLTFLQEHYPSLNMDELVLHLHRSPAAINRKARHLQLYKEIRNPWTETEVSYLKEHYTSQTAEELAQDLNRSIKSVKSKIKRMDLQKWKWTEEENNYIKKNYQIEPLSTLTQFLDRTPEAIVQQAKRLKVHKKPKRWTKEETKLLLNNYHIMTQKELSTLLEYSGREIESRAKDLGLHWTNEEIAHLEEHYKSFSVEELAQQLNKPVMAIRRKKGELNLQDVKKWTDNDTEFVKKNYNVMSISELSKRLGFGKSTVRDHLNELMRTQELVPSDKETRKQQQEERQYERKKTLREKIGSLIPTMKSQDPTIVVPTHDKALDVAEDLFTHPNFKYYGESKFDILSLAIIAQAFFEVTRSNRLPFDLPLKTRRNVLKMRQRLQKLLGYNSKGGDY